MAHAVQDNLGNRTLAAVALSRFVPHRRCETVDRAFAAYFKGVELIADFTKDVPLEWLRKNLELELSPEETASWTTDNPGCYDIRALSEPGSGQKEALYMGVDVAQAQTTQVTISGSDWH